MHQTPLPVFTESYLEKELGKSKKGDRWLDRRGTRPDGH
jgi:hypothetical protein